MKRVKIRHAVILVAFLSSLLPVYSHAQVTPPQPTQRLGDTWEFSIYPYVWFTGISGDVTVKDRTAHVSVPFSDIWNNLDFAGLMQMETRKGRWGMFLQPNYIKLSPTASLSKPVAADGTGGPDAVGADVRLDSRMLIIEFGGFYRIFEKGYTRNTTGTAYVDILAGGRYWYVQNHISLNLPQFGVGFSDTTYGNIIDPMVGARMKAYLASKLSLTLRGDAAGFGVSSNSSHISWNGVGTLGYDVSPCLSLVAGYRYLYINYSASGGFGARLALQGPVVGLGYKF